MRMPLFYGGAQFALADLEGRRLGRQVGARAWQKAQSFFDGSAAPAATMDQQISQFIEINNFDQIFRPNRLYIPVVSVFLPAASLPHDEP